jgi:hypothetical protein
MQVFKSWVDYIAAHASDPDYRKDEDPTEGPKHYFDIDSYPEFLANGKVTTDLQELIDEHGYVFVEENGFLPWATSNTYDSLVKYLTLADREKAKLFAADLGHYVADGHVPLHLTYNYNGQFTDNRGIHYRYESQMINSFHSEIVYSGSDIERVRDVDEYIFNYIYDNYRYVDSVLLADDYARSVNANTDSEEYTAALWEKTGAFTIKLMRNASKSLTELIYTAWLEAGRPDLGTFSEDFSRQVDPELKVSPNPISSHATIEFKLATPSSVRLQLNSVDGKISEILLDSYNGPGNFRMNLDPDKYPVGLYILNMETLNSLFQKKIIIIN